MAYVHWTGKVDFALMPSEVPVEFLDHPAIRTLRQPVYATSLKIEDDETLGLAGELLFVALQKVRDAQLP